MDFQVLPSGSNGDATNGVVRSLLLTEANKVHIHRRTYLQEKSSLPLISKLELPKVSKLGLQSESKLTISDIGSEHNTVAIVCGDS